MIIIDLTCLAPDEIVMLVFPIVPKGSMRVCFGSSVSASQ